MKVVKEAKPIDFVNYGTIIRTGITCKNPLQSSIEFVMDLK